MNRTSWLALIAEFGPIVLFFIAGRLTDFFTAVTLLMSSTVIAATLSWLLDKRIPWLPIVSALFVLGGGALTLWYHHPDAIIVADTLFYICNGSILLYSLATKRLLLKSLFGTIFGIENEGWRILAIRWCIFLFLCAIANEVARTLLTPEQWIDYRFFKSIFVTIFATYQLRLVKRYRLPETSRFGLKRRF